MGVGDPEGLSPSLGEADSDIIEQRWGYLRSENCWQNMEALVGCLYPLYWLTSFPHLSSPTGIGGGAPLAGCACVGIGRPQMERAFDFLSLPSLRTPSA
jgi:hypothetical protein